MLWGDARQTIRELGASMRSPLDLIWHDAFSPRRCPPLWTREFLAALAALLTPEGRWISYSSAAAVRRALAEAGLELAAIEPAEGQIREGGPNRSPWSGGTVASPASLVGEGRLRTLTAMEREHLDTSAAVPYRDPSGTADPLTILDERRQAQAEELARCTLEPSSSWRRRWEVDARA